MDPYVVDNTPLWDLSQASSYTHLADDDFLALLQKQFPQANNDVLSFNNSVNPQSITRYPLPSLSPPSEDSSPSPQPDSAISVDEPGESALKRKASDDALDDGPNSKGQSTKKAATSSTRRKASGTGGPPKDETRLLKRKEQNRAAQRAFRERKEKHVKDLEDKVAELEAKNEATEHENENLRDLLSRLQNENLALKQTSFTFTVPPNAASSTNTPPTAGSYTSSPPFTASSGSTATSPTMSTPDFSKVSNPLEWSSLTAFDPAMLNLLDENAQPTATDGARHMDFGFGPTAGLAEGAPWTTIASNPMFMSFASNFDSPPSNSPPVNNGISFNNHDSNQYFDLNSMSWSPPTQPPHTSSLEELISGFTANPADFNFPPPGHPTSDSPVAHHASTSNQQNSMFNPPSHSPVISNSSSPSSSMSDPLFDTPKDSSASDSDHDIHSPSHDKKECPRTKEELARSIESSGLSPFAPVSNMAALNPMVRCAEGTTFPKTQQNEQNVEVLTAWRSITSNPQFKDVDINDLCSQFTSKARCDGKKVVLEPQGVESIIRNLASKQ
jgi:AP-1-like factor